MKSFLPNNTRCPGCGQGWDLIGTVSISSIVEPENHPEGHARIGIVLWCDDCECGHEAWLNLSDFLGVQP